MTTPTDIDRAAPVIAHHEIDIAASLDTVWQMHMNVNAWPTWHLEVTAVTSTIYDVVDHSRTLWGGEAQGVMGMHEWRFESTAEGVHVVTTESFSGDPVAADLPTMQTILDNSLTTWLARLKEKAESLAREAGRQPVG